VGTLFGGKNPWDLRSHEELGLTKIEWSLDGFGIYSHCFSKKEDSPNWARVFLDSLGILIPASVSTME
jgi:hypothetical protein